MKRLYDDIIFNGRFTNSDVISDLAGRSTIYGESRQIAAMLKASSAKRIINSLNGDEEVAQGIAIGIELGRPNFEMIGESFLVEKIPGYQKSILGVAMTKVMLNGLSGDRVDAIIKGVADALEEKEDISDEAQAALFASEIVDEVSKFKSGNEYSRWFSMTMLNVYKGTTTNKTVSFKYPEKYEKLKNRPPEKTIIRRRPERKNELETAFDCYCSNFDALPEPFRTALETYSKEAIVAFYVVSMREGKLSALYAEQTKKE